MTQHFSTKSSQSTSDCSDDETNQERIELRPFADVKLSPIKNSRRISKPFKVASFRSFIKPDFKKASTQDKISSTSVIAPIQTKEDMEEYRSTVSISPFVF